MPALPLQLPRLPGSLLPGGQLLLQVLLIFLLLLCRLLSLLFLSFLLLLLLLNIAQVPVGGEEV